LTNYPFDTLLGPRCPIFGRDEDNCVIRSLSARSLLAGAGDLAKLLSNRKNTGVLNGGVR